MLSFQNNNSVFTPPAKTPLAIETHYLPEAPGVTVISLEGNLWLDNSPRLTAAIVDAAKIKPSAVVIDMSNVKAMDSTGLGTVVNGRSLLDKGTSFSLLAPNRAVRRMFEITHTEQVFTAIHKDQGEMLTTLATSPSKPSAAGASLSPKTIELS